MSGRNLIWAFLSTLSFTYYEIDNTLWSEQKETHELIFFFFLVWWIDLFQVSTIQAHCKPPTPSKKKNAALLEGELEAIRPVLWLDWALGLWGMYGEIVMAKIWAFGSRVTLPWNIKKGTTQRRKYISGHVFSSSATWWSDSCAHHVVAFVRTSTRHV